MVGQEGKEDPFVPVPLERQKWAMTLLNNYAFAPNAFKAPNSLFNTFSGKGEVGAERKTQKF